MQRYRVDFGYGRYYFEPHDTGDWMHFVDHEAAVLRLKAGLLAHACYCGSSDLDPAVHREDCAYRKWASPEHPSDDGS